MEDIRYRMLGPRARRRRRRRRRRRKVYSKKGEDGGRVLQKSNLGL